VHQSGESSRTGRLSKAGSPLLRWAAVEAAQQAWRLATVPLREVSPPAPTTNKNQTTENRDNELTSGP